MTTKENTIKPNTVFNYREISYALSKALTNVDLGMDDLSDAHDKRAMKFCEANIQILEWFQSYKDRMMTYNAWKVMLYKKLELELKTKRGIDYDLRPFFQDYKEILEKEVNQDYTEEAIRGFKDMLETLKTYY